MQALFLYVTQSVVKNTVSLECGFNVPYLRSGFCRDPRDASICLKVLLRTAVLINVVFLVMFCQQQLTAKVAIPYYQKHRPHSTPAKKHTVSSNKSIQRWSKLVYEYYKACINVSQNDKRRRICFSLFYCLQLELKERTSR